MARELNTSRPLNNPLDLKFQTDIMNKINLKMLLWDVDNGNINLKMVEQMSVEMKLYEVYIEKQKSSSLQSLPSLMIEMLYEWYNKRYKEQNGLPELFTILQSVDLDYLMDKMKLNKTPRKSPEFEDKHLKHQEKTILMKDEDIMTKNTFAGEENERRKPNRLKKRCALILIAFFSFLCGILIVCSTIVIDEVTDRSIRIKQGIVFAFHDGCPQEQENLPNLPVATEGSTGIYSKELGILVCGGHATGNSEQLPKHCWTLKIGSKAWDPFPYHLQRSRIGSYMKQCHREIIIIGGHSSDYLHDGCEPSQEILDLNNITAGWQLRKDQGNCFAIDQTIDIPCMGLR